MTDHWVACGRPTSPGRLRLFCFPYAGGAASSFSRWSDALPPTVQVCPVELPGRGRRQKEPPFTELGPLVRTEVRGILPYLDQPFAFFGHSMGALIGFEFARELRRTYGLSPAHLFVSAHRAPQLPAPDRSTRTLADGELVARLRSLNGTSEDVLAHRELLGLVLPILRADFAVCESYTYSPEAALDCPISSFGGLKDPTASQEELEAWREQTNASFSLQMLSGDHFFVNTARGPLLQALARDLCGIHPR